MIKNFIPIMIAGAALHLNAGRVCANEGDSPGPDKQHVDDEGKGTCMDEWNLMVSFVGFTIKKTSKKEIDSNEDLRFFLLDASGKVLSWRNALLKDGIAKEKMKINEKCFVWIEEFFKQNDVDKEYHNKYGL